MSTSPFDEIQILVAHDELHPDPRIPGMETVEERGLRDSVDQGFGAGHADDADQLAPGGFELPLEASTACSTVSA